MHRIAATSRRVLLMSAAAVLAAIAVSLGSPSGAAAQSPDQAFKPPGTVPGFVYEQWAAEMVERVYKRPAGPASTDCQTGQSRKLWFVFVTPDENGVVNCRVPFGTPIFMEGPWLSCSNNEPWPFFAETDAGLRRCAENLVRRHFRSIGLRIDGHKVHGLGRYLITTDPFDLVLPTDNFFELPAGPARIVVKGYFLYIAPLSRGVHEIVGNASLGGFGGGVVTFRITVV